MRQQSSEHEGHEGRLGEDGSVRLVDALPWLAALRDDERTRATSRFRRMSLEAGARLEATPDAPPVLGILLMGRLRVRRTVAGIPSSPTVLWPGDRWDEVAVFADVAGDTAVEAETPAVVALLDRSAFLAIVAEFPIVWLAVAERLSHELKTVSNVLREIQDLAASESTHSLSRLLDAKRRQIGRRAGISRAAISQLFGRVVSAHVREPTFWVLAGFTGAVLVSRAVVATILRLGLHEQLFNLRDSGGANPLHIHHFNYGFAIIVATGLLAFFPAYRRMLRVLAASFGIGLGLVFDEFALIWNLRPDYYQPLNYWAHALLAALLVQMVYFRRLYAELFELLLTRIGRRA
jgi:CRP-like cAMP-binding protein